LGPHDRFLIRHIVDARAVPVYFSTHKET